ncbi:hypothetical protein CWB89_16630 [Pseudoalteromonas piscicida]|uniref:Uncharacterized protein n=1 Tax=Pseudoalteromonas piscicida TaxID=43662 RepID=A0AAQ2ER62_PSEO7|nr:MULTISPECIES: hypothetical protein [Pseudoalteromonas]KJY91568.1 hypothetical protein TW75_04070 [Pseudoalteromonas piscicida]TMN37705.1 hypothetical protein CWB94_15885 [Pseudoalteromonas piscicida]TMN45925.1 hypothetical protein CWB95_00210 [Pseudoalteromonas piscicida]TMN47580.1 hypothetical protein CWB91_21040 [Pseudoalteromonas piscicida]TMN53659.1 hypothetical protein CWB92_08320 [Pseudoalteromonas piscicida]
MIPAKKLLNTINEHWSVLELLFKRFKLADFSLKDVQNILKQKNPSWSSERIYKETNRLLQQEIIIPLAKSSQLEINRAIADFASFLLQEESLGLAEEITVLVKDLERLGNRIAQAGEEADYSELRRFSRIMDERVRKIVKLFEHNESAIMNLVEQAKSDTSTLSLGMRYKAVLEAFDEYIEPMLEMVDIHGSFQRCFDQIELQVSEQIDEIEQLGRGAADKRMLEQLRTRILDMHLIGRESLSRSADLLMPLREELRRNTLITRQASKVLGQIRKRGVDRLLSPVQPEFVSDIQRFNLGQKRHMVAYMASLVEFEHEEYQLPDHNDVPAYQSPNIPDYNSVKTRFQQTGKKRQALLGFLSDSYPDLEADEMLFLYQKLINESDLALSQEQQKSKITIASHTFSLYPFSAKAKQD